MALKINGITIPEAELETSFSRSSGPGGQNVNKVNTKATLRWSFADSRALRRDVRERFEQRFAARITKEGDVVINCGRFREQTRNLEECRARLQQMITSVLKPPKKRRPTKPSRSSVEKRITGKKVKSSKKKQRGKVSTDD